MQIRDWLHVEDHVRGIFAALVKGRPGEVYNLGGGNERPNLEVAKAVLRHTGRPESLLTFVKDRPGHDRRYAIDARKAKRELGWTPGIRFDVGLAATVAWYRENPGWVERARSGDHRAFQAKHYGSSAFRRAAALPAPDRQTTPVRRRRR
jgi:dTDP-glucose 4,6-dehydratase